MLRTAIAPWLSSTYFSWYGTLSLDIAYVIVQAICLIGYRRASRFFDDKLSYVLLGSLQALLAVLAIGGMGQHGMLTYALVCCAAVVNSLLFLGWSRPLTCVLADSPRTALVLAAMAVGMAIWVGVSQLPAGVALWLTAFLPIAIGALALVAPAYVTPIRAEEAARPTGFPAVDDPHDPVAVASLSQRLRCRAWSDFALIPPLFLLGAFVLELAPGFIMGVVNLDFAGSGEPLQNPYVVCTAIMAVICLAAIPIRDADRMQRMLERFVMPLLSLGLLAFSLLTPTTSVIGPALTLAGSNIIEACFFAQFARVSHEHGAEPIRVFSLGGIAIQLGSLAAYLLGPIAHGQAQVLAATSLALVFVLILYGTMNGKGLSFGSLGRADATSGRRAKAVATRSPDAMVPPSPSSRETAPQDVLPAKSTEPAGTTGAVGPTGQSVKVRADASRDGRAADLEQADRQASGNASSPQYNEVLRDTAQKFASEHGLSEREGDVLVLAVQGKNTATMADQLCIAQTTVKTHLKHIYQKAGVADRQELIVLFERFES